MKRISQWFYRISTLRGCIVVTVLAVAYTLWGMWFHTRQISKPLLDTRFGYSKAEAAEYLLSLTDEGKSEYAEMLLVWDNLFPFFYGATCLFWLSYVWKTYPFRRPVFSLLNLAPLGVMAADWTENFFIRRMITDLIRSGEISAMNATVASLATHAKWCFSVLMYGLVLTGIVMAIRRKIRKRKSGMTA